MDRHRQAFCETGFAIISSGSTDSESDWRDLGDISSLGVSIVMLRYDINSATEYIEIPAIFRPCICLAVVAAETGQTLIHKTIHSAAKFGGHSTFCG